MISSQLTPCVSQVCIHGRKLTGYTAYPHVVNVDIEGTRDVLNFPVFYGPLQDYMPHFSVREHAVDNHTNIQHLHISPYHLSLFS